jgi:RsiW-degrading membrane proteinase PrsW (M82 family)
MRQLESFFWGIIAALGALIFQLILYVGFSTYAFPVEKSPSFSEFFSLPLFVLAGVLIEEGFKYLIISKRIELFSQERTYIVNSIFVGLGFFATELGLIYLSDPIGQIKSVIEILIIHIGTAGIIGYYVATKNPKKISTFLLALTMATALHVAYNFSVMQRNLITNGVVIFILATLIFFNIFNFIFIKTKLAQD